jgi:hypothetical protein
MKEWRIGLVWNISLGVLGSYACGVVLHIV